MTNVLLRNWRGRWLAAGLRAIIVVGTLATFCASDDEMDEPAKKSLRYITEKEITAIGELMDRASQDEQVFVKPSWSSAREQARGFRGHWAYMAFKRRESRYRHVPPKLQEAEDKALAKWIAELESRSDSNLGYAVDTRSIYQIQSAALDQQFPKWAFVFVPYAVHSRQPPSPYDSGGLDFPTWRILAIGETAVHTFLDQHGDPTDFLSFLQSEGIRIRSKKDASLFWDAYCSFYRMPWSSGKHTRVDDRTWRLNDQATEPREPFLEVVTDPDGNILRLRFAVPEAKEPQEEKGNAGTSGKRKSP